MNSKNLNLNDTADNIGYAVRYRSPKPLLASHTRQTLSAIACMNGRAWRK